MAVGQKALQDSHNSWNSLFFHQRESQQNTTLSNASPHFTGMFTLITPPLACFGRGGRVRTFQKRISQQPSTYLCCTLAIPAPLLSERYLQHAARPSEQMLEHICSGHYSQSTFSAEQSFTYFPMPFDNTIHKRWSATTLEEGSFKKWLMRALIPANASLEFASFPVWQFVFNVLRNRPEVWKYLLCDTTLKYSSNPGKIILTHAVASQSYTPVAIYTYIAVWRQKNLAADLQSRGRNRSVLSQREINK